MAAPMSTEEMVFLLEARQIVKAGLKFGNHSKCHCADEIDAGKWDNGGKIRAALGGLQRGVEIGLSRAEPAQ